jgi:hypothetical protein
MALLAGLVVGGGGCGDDAAPPAPPIADGEPLPIFAPADWHWVEVAGARCRDGSPTGLGVRYGTENKLLIYFRGGGLCFDALTCGLSLSSWGADDMAEWPDTNFAGGIFTPESPLAGWSQIHIPYCTGDVHAGHHAQVAIEGVEGLQDFVGADNFALDLARVLPTFRGVDQVLIVGTSAGGLGATLHFDTIARSFPSTPVDLLVDSGPLLPEKYFPTCFQSRLRDLYAMDPLPAGCAGCNRADGGGLDALVPWLLDAWPHHRFAWLLSQRDFILRILYGYGSPDADTEPCTTQDAMAESWFGAALDELVTALAPHPNAAWWIIDDTQHTWVQDKAFFEEDNAGVSPVGFCEALIDGECMRVGR